MSGIKRKNFMGNLKAKVALEAIRGIKAVNGIGREFGVHPTEVGLWKKELQEQASQRLKQQAVPWKMDSLRPFYFIRSI